MLAASASSALRSARYASPSAADSKNRLAVRREKWPKSSISAHFSDNNRDVYLDVFSCKSFDENRVVQVVDKYFEPKIIYMLSLGREAKHPVQPPFSQLR